MFYLIPGLGADERVFQRLQPLLHGETESVALAAAGIGRRNAAALRGPDGGRLFRPTPLGCWWACRLAGWWGWKSIACGRGCARCSSAACPMPAACRRCCGWCGPRAVPAVSAPVAEAVSAGRAVVFRGEGRGGVPAVQAHSARHGAALHPLGHCPPPALGQHQRGPQHPDSGHPATGCFRPAPPRWSTSFRAAATSWSSATPRKLPGF